MRERESEGIGFCVTVNRCLEGDVVTSVLVLRGRVGVGGVFTGEGY